MTHAQHEPAQPEPVEPGPYDHEADGAFDDDPLDDAQLPVQLPPREPVATASAVQILIGVGVTVGWFTATDPIIGVLLTVAGAAAAVYTWLTARGWVKPWPRTLPPT